MKIGSSKKRKRMIVAGFIVLAVLGAGFVSWVTSPWPRALLMRALFEFEGKRVSDRLAEHVPPNVKEQLNLVYDPTDTDARLDVFQPGDNERRPLPVIVWIHGGGWLAGSKDQVANYLRILAAKGYTVVGIDYSLAPGQHFPTPLRQLDRALAYLTEHANSLRVDAHRFVLAGDSAGAQIAAQYANLMLDAAHSATVGVRPQLTRERLRGLVLFCGAYDPRMVRLDGPFRSVLLTMFWAYLGEKDFASHPNFEQVSVPQFMHAGLPPMFISAGNADPLEAQSQRVAARARELGVDVDVLFFPRDRQPALQHEFQFNFSDPAGLQALDRLSTFVAHVVTP